jgi:hypothetical protein
VLLVQRQHGPWASETRRTACLVTGYQGMPAVISNSEKKKRTSTTGNNKVNADKKGRSGGPYDSGGHRGLVRSLGAALLDSGFHQSLSNASRYLRWSHPPSLVFAHFPALPDLRNGLATSSEPKHFGTCAPSGSCRSRRELLARTGRVLRFYGGPSATLDAFGEFDATLWAGHIYVGCHARDVRDHDDFFPLCY